MPRIDNNPNACGWALDAPEDRRKRLCLPLLTGVGLLLSLACGVADTGATRDAFVSFAAIAALAPLMTQLIAVVRFLLAKKALPHRDFASIDQMLRLSALLHAALSLAAGAAAVLFCIRSWTGAADALVAAGLLLAGGCSACVHRFYASIPAFEQKARLD